MNNIDFVHVYITRFPFKVKEKDVYPKQREEEVNACKSQKVKKQKYYVWKLLESSIEKTLGVNFKEISFIKEGDKWGCDICNFSMSHSNDVVVVAISNQKIGVDVEKIDLPRFEKIKQEKILVKEEQQGLKPEDKALYMNHLWAVKEAIFKSENKKIFSPNKINTQEYDYVIKPFKINEEDFVLSVATSLTKIVNFYQI